MNDYRQNPAFQQMNPEKQQMIEELVQSLTGKQLTEALPVVTAWKSKMESKGLSFTPQENELLTELFSAQMTPAQKKQFMMLQQFMQKK